MFKYYKLDDDNIRKIYIGSNKFYIKKKFSKEQILENYINIVNFGPIYGIKNAAKYYYNKEPKELNIYESAMLAGKTQLPNLYDPYTNKEETFERRPGKEAGCQDRERTKRD